MTQAVLTFSRGGVFNVVLCVAAFGAHQLHSQRTRTAFLITIALVATLGVNVILPAIDDWTGGVMSERFSAIDPGLRRQMAEYDLKIFRENPVLGVGPGMAKRQRFSYFKHSIAAHTEYTRLLAEHGSFGLLALILMLAMASRAYLRAPGFQAKAWVTVFVGWAMLEMLHAAMRIAAISFVFGLGMIVFFPPQRHLAPGPVQPQPR